MKMQKLIQDAPMQ